MKMNLGAKLYAASAAALLIMLLLTGGAIYSNLAAQAALNGVFEHNVRPLLAVQSIDRNLQEIRFRIAGVLLDQLPRVGSRNQLREARAAIPQHWREFTALNRSESAEDAALIKKIEAGLSSLQALFDKVDKEYQSDDRKGLEAIIEDDWPAVTTQVVKPLNELIALHHRQMAETYNASIQLGQRLNNAVLAIFAIAFVLMLLVAFFLTRSITRPVREVQRVLGAVAQGDLTVKAKVASNDEIGAMAAALNDAIEALNLTVSGVRQAADGLAQASSALSAEATTAREQTTAQVDSVMQVSAAMQELTVSVAEISGRTKDVAEASSNARQIAQDSSSAVADSDKTIQRTLAAVSSSSQAVGDLSTEIERISAIARVIKEIADQTNLLALNAAIEAARAGESGRGFAVVADEVRKLAERTTASTVDITQMITAIQGKAQSVVQAMAAVSSDVRDGAAQTGALGESFAHILDAADQLTQLAAAIAGGTTEQTQVAQQTARSMETIAQVAERAGESVRQVANTAAETSLTAQELKALVARFRVA